MQPFNNKFRDDPHDWTEETAPQPLSFDKQRQAEFQREVDAICGLTHDGQSVVRLVWAGDALVFRTLKVDALHGRALEAAYVPKYLTRLKGTDRTVVTRRWMFEVFDPIEQAEDALSGYVTVPGGGLYLPPELAKAKSESGQYNPLYTVADHSKCDPSWCTPTNYSCVGDYRAPGKQDLETFKRAEARKAADRTNPQLDPYKPIPQHVINLYQKRTDDFVEDRDNRAADMRRERFTDDKKTLRRTSV